MIRLLGRNHKVLPSEHLAPVIILAYYTGMLRPEILKLTRYNVHLDRDIEQHEVV